ncbi:hypothetical protein GCM10023322_71400 [Rugosimonospora acidiphila]|uniref:Uncharacterized protein n=1 Tax=Rugosimonospora acidiphila TaxID=556531 RepID=A0ABP9SM52_9ACTN
MQVPFFASGTTSVPLGVGPTDAPAGTLAAGIRQVAAGQRVIDPASRRTGPDQLRIDHRKLEVERLHRVTPRKS